MRNQTPLRRAFVVVGHPNAGFETAQTLLNQAGIELAKPGKQQGLSPEETFRTLLSHSALGRGYSLVEQIDPSPLWQGLLLDLMLANQDAPLWGWADPGSIYFLDCLCNIDPVFCFILVYDNPAQAMVRALQDSMPNIEQLESFKQGWKNYNQALLNFYSRHQDRCLLIDTAEVTREPLLFLELMKERFGCAVNFNDFSVTHNDLDILRLMFATTLLEGSESASVYADMQSMADLPSSGNVVCSPLDAWNAYENYLVSALAKIKESEEENHLLLTQLHTVQEALEYHCLETQASQANAPAAAVEKSKSTLKAQKTAIHYGAPERVKQQLSYRLGNTLIQRSNSFTGILTLPAALIRQVREFNEDKKTKAGQKLPPIERYADAHEAEKVKQHLSYRLGKTLLENYRSPLGWIKLPFAIRKEIREFEHRRTQRRH